MKLKTINQILLLFLILFLTKIEAQENFNSPRDIENFTTNSLIIDKIEDHILDQQLDSVAYLISQQKTTPYIQSLSRISKNNNPTYLDYYKFTLNLGTRIGLNYESVNNYINKNIKIPIDKNEVNLDYVNIKWIQIARLREDFSAEEASYEQEKLEKYINQFDPKNNNTIKAQLLASVHHIVLYYLSRDFKKSKELCLSSLKKSKELKDYELEIIFLYHLCDSYIHEITVGKYFKVDEYIKACEHSLELEKKLPTKSVYHIGTIIHLIDAYLFKGGQEKRVDELLEELYKNPRTRPLSYSLYARYISYLNPNSPKCKSIFKQFEVTNLQEFVKKIETLGEKVLKSNDFFHILNDCSIALEYHGFYEEALEYKKKSLEQNEKYYSQELSQSLSRFKTRQAVREKELEIEKEKEHSRLYIIIASLIAGLLLITLIFFVRKRKQSELLEIKNNQINQALKEKELLIKEVHHRVKNNFQIISSLLELQSKGIEDEKALAIAQDGKNRVKSMALIHQKLYQNEDGLINFEEYITLLVDEIASMYDALKKITIVVHAKNLFFDIDTAIPLGLIINELVTNTYKYAFSEKETGKLDITINRFDENSYKLIISDNGSGFSNDFDIKKTKSFGLRLVTRLVKQLRGTLSFINNNGTTFEVIFKDLHARKNID
ncbi:sensor histidine kinase [Mariniflexile sp. HMF6888]|uniref:sensor histidine kinase n=1 Tax=Mariniflexile sp. HMF6888 TaxID=3373086 RepID=UPI00379A6F3F